MVQHAQPSHRLPAPPFLVRPERLDRRTRCAAPAVRGEEVGPDAGRGGGCDGGRDGRGGGGGHDEGVEVAQEVEVGWEEDVEEAGLDEVGRAGYSLRKIARQLST